MTTNTNTAALLHRFGLTIFLEEIGHQDMEKIY
jgi:hypothetical protein